ncbi:MAG TPA: enolase C-terminal domain-like protein [Planctomycetaceae bacterium]|nr:enolase C-terminal domain-like protein [Planctomycetaceae bacterium]
MTVTIAQVETIPLLYPVAGHFKFFENAAGRPMGRPAVLVCITASNGAEGWGECVPSPRWSYETVETVVTTIDKYLAPELLGRSPLEIDELHSIMNRTIAPSFSTGQPICKAGVDLALFDLSGKLLNQTARERWSRHDNSTVELSWTLNPRSLVKVEALVSQAHERGYRHFNIKVSPDPDYDLELVRLVRRLAPKAELWVDANGGYSERDALAIAPKLGDIAVSFFEQPVAPNRLASLARLKEQGALPIILDEGIVSVVELEEFHRLKLLDGVAVKVARVGGLEPARRQIEFLHENGLIFLGSGLTDPDVSLSGSLALFSAYGLAHAAALNGPQFLTASVLKSPFQADSGKISAAGGCGLGIEVDRAKIEGLRLAEV